MVVLNAGASVMIRSLLFIVFEEAVLFVELMVVFDVVFVGGPTGELHSFNAVSRV